MLISLKKKKSIDPKHLNVSIGLYNLIFDHNIIYNIL